MADFYDTIARYYDAENEDVVDDLALFSAVAEDTDGLILDVGCGIGRVMFHLATEGRTIHGLDRSAEMLARARRKQAQRPDLRERCTLLQADILIDALPGAKYGLIIITYNTFMQMYGDGQQRSLLKKLAAVLDEGGTIVIDIPNAGEAYAAQDDSSVTLERTFTEPESGNLVMQQSVSRIERTEQLQYISWIYDEIDSSGLVHRTVAPMILRYTFPAEMDLLLESVGLRRVDRYGDYDGNPFEGECPRMIVLAQKSR